MAADLIITLSPEPTINVKNVSGGGTNELRDELEALKIVVNNLSTVVGTIGGDLDIAEGDIDNLEERVTNVEGILYFPPE